MPPAEFRTSVPIQVAGLKQPDGTYTGKLSIGGHVILWTFGHETAEKAANVTLSKFTNFAREFLREDNEKTDSQDPPPQVRSVPRLIHKYGEGE